MEEKTDKMWNLLCDRVIDMAGPGASTSPETRNLLIAMMKKMIIPSEVLSEDKIDATTNFLEKTREMSNEEMQAQYKYSPV